MDGAIVPLLWRRDIEGDGQPFALFEGHRSMPHAGWEQSQVPNLGLDLAPWRQVDAQLLVWLSERQPTRILGLCRILRRKVDIQGRTDPPKRMNMAGVMAARTQPHLPAAGKTDPAVARLAQRRMLGVMWRKLRH